MDLRFDTSLIQGYKSPTQIARVLTEDWLVRNMYCPVCGTTAMRRAEPNAPVKDSVCEHCRAQFELKSKREYSEKYMTKVNDGVYDTMIERITSLENPNFFFMHYDHFEVNNLIVVPKCFFVPDIIEKRKALSNDARRSGWEGCNILLGMIPDFAKIPIIRNGEVLDPSTVCEAYNRAYSLQTDNMEGRGWLMDVLRCLERLDSAFALKQMYVFIEDLKKKHPHNNNVEAKIRQQLQFLRDKGIIRFTRRGNYEKIWS